EELKPYYDAHRDEEPVTILATGGQIELHLAADGDETSARAELLSRERELLAIFADRVFGYDDDSLESVIGRLLTERKESVADAHRVEHRKLYWPTTRTMFKWFTTQWALDQLRLFIVRGV